MAPNEIDSGKVIINKRDGSIKSVTIIQGSKRFYGKYEESPNGAFLATFADGYMTRIGDQEIWVDGWVLLAEGNNVLWSKRLERPNDCQIANNGNIIINELLRNKEGLGGRTYIFGPKGETLFEKTFDSNLSSCAISKDETYAAASTLLPDNSIYLIEVKDSSVRWRIKNRSRVAIGLAFSDFDNIDIFTGKNQVNKTYDYSLTIDGNFTDTSADQFNKIYQAIQLTGDDSIRLLIGFLASTNTSEILKGLDALSAKLYKKEQTNYTALFPNIMLLVENNQPVIHEPALKVLMRMCIIYPEIFDTAASKIIDLSKKMLQTPYKGTQGLATLGQLGAIDENLAVNVFPIIYDRLQNSPLWNERRFAAFAVSNIGKTFPGVVKEAIPVLIGYLGESDWWLPKIREADKNVIETHGVKISVSIVDNVDPSVSVRDAALGALGNIGEKGSELVKEAIPVIASCLQLPYWYTRKLAIIALGKIAKDNAAFVEPVLSSIKIIAEHETDERVRLEAKRLLARI